MSGIRALAVCAFAAVMAAPPAQAQVVVTPIEKVASRLLAAHNAERTRLGLKPLTWSAKLSEHARKWAQTLAVSDRFEHAPVGADGDEGENLWTGTRDDYTPEEMVAFFIDEGKLFKRSKFPDVSTSGRWEDVGHYTQIVWKDTREVGCAIASNPRSDYLVCRYSPAGNVIGQPVYDYMTADQWAKAGAAAPATVAPAAVSPSAPNQRASKKRRRGG